MSHQGQIRAFCEKPGVRPLLHFAVAQLALLAAGGLIVGALHVLGSRQSLELHLLWAGLAVLLSVPLAAAITCLLSNRRTTPRSSSPPGPSPVESQRRLAADISHELRTPLSVLLGQVQVFSREPRTTEEQAQFLAGLQDEVRRLAGIVNGLLMLSEGRTNLEPGSLREEPLNEIVIEAVQRSQVLARQCDVRMVPRLHSPAAHEPELLVAGEPELMRIMVENLLRSVVRTSGGPMVWVIVSREGDHGRIAICNQHCGLRIDHLSRAFDASQRSVDRPLPEAGLGLLLAQGVARLHRARIKADATPEGGLQLAVSLPLARDEGLTGPPRLPSGSSQEMLISKP